MPTPTMIGGQGLGPAFSTADRMNSRTPFSPSAGLSILMVLIFSLPKPLGAKKSSSLSPGTIS